VYRCRHLARSPANCSGWGLFNLVEGIIDHHVLDIHHVRDLPEHVPAYDWAFLLVAGVGIVLLGWVLATQRTEAR
jgi:uncharacterized membrane protein